MCKRKRKKKKLKFLDPVINVYEEPGSKVSLPEIGPVRLDDTPRNSFSLKKVGDFLTYKEKPLFCWASPIVRFI